ncbi:hypothetical protein [Limimaricola cinnabarinus]|uniref:hypothetical protein n=1 Tax=Limimaricola cinnabarinus TaxID=1125964 RepID=UPI002FDF8FF7
MTTNTLAERLREAEADEQRLMLELLRAYQAGEFWLTPCASIALDAKDAEIVRLRPLAEAWVQRLEDDFIESENNDDAYRKWQDALAAFHFKGDR